MFAFTFAVAGSLAACSGGRFLGEAVYMFVGDMSNGSRSGFEPGNHYEPVISFANDSFIRVKYLDNDENAQPDEAMKIISKHCNDSFTETSRRTSHGLTYIEAHCKRGTTP